MNHGQEGFGNGLRQRPGHQAEAPHTGMDPMDADGPPSMSMWDTGGSDYRGDDMLGAGGGMMGGRHGAGGGGGTGMADGEVMGRTNGMNAGPASAGRGRIGFASPNNTPW